MANMIKFYRGLVSTLPTAGTDGALYITTDEGAIYLGTGTGMKRLGDFVQVDNVAALPEKAHESCLYYCVAENILAKWNGSEWKQINKQPTAEELKTLLGLGAMAYKSEVVESDLGSELKAKVNASAAANHSHDNKALLDTYTQTEENLADAVAKKHNHANADELALIASGDVAKWNAAEKNAKDYADGLNTAMDTRMTKAEGSIATLTGEGEGSVKKALADAKAYADQAEIDAVSTVVGTDADEASANTVKGAKKYADAIGASAATDATNKANAAEKNAKDYADTLDVAMDKRVDALEAAIGEGGSVDVQINAAINALDVDAVTAGTGEVIGSVAEVDGKVVVEKKTLSADDIPTLTTAKISDFATEMAKKQDVVAFEGAYDKDTNKAATMADVATAVAGLSGAMHFEGVKNAIPDDVTGYESGDVIIVGNKEYVFDGTSFKEIGDETIYAIKGEIKNADIAEDAAIAQSKIAGLGDALDAKANKADLGTMAAETATDYIKKTDAVGYDDILTKTAAGTTYETIANADLIRGRIETLEKAPSAGITAENITDWNDAVAKEHEHANKAVIDGITSEQVAAWDAAQVNVIETVKVNGEAVSVVDKAVNIAVPTGALASKNTVAESDLETALATKINGKAEQTALDTTNENVSKNAEAIAANTTEIAKKANSADVYAKTETYTQAEVNAAIKAAVDAATEWGSF